MVKARGAANRPSTPARRRIVEAAADAFCQHGFGATTLQAIADAANTHVQTVYLAFGSKAGLFAAVIELVRAAGDDEDVAPSEWPWVQELMSSSDPREKLRLYANHARRTAPRAAPLVAVLRVAARDDEALEAVRARYANEQYEGMLALARALDDLGALRAGLGVERAADVLWTFTTTYESYDLMVGERRWSADEYERWLGDLFCDLLLEPESTRTRTRAAGHADAS